MVARMACCRDSVVGIVPVWGRSGGRPGGIAIGVLLDRGGLVPAEFFLVQFVRGRFLHLAA